MGRTRRGLVSSTCRMSTLSGREWGHPTGQPWISLHGWLDNAGTFDTLAPLFPPKHRLLCLDYPGHGYSSPLPPGQIYHYLESIGCIRRVADYMGWDKFGLLGHSSTCRMSTLSGREVTIPVPWGVI